MHFITGMYSPPLYITTCHARDGVSDTPEHSNDIYLPSSSLIGDTDTVAWLRAARCTGTRPHRASQAPIACTASLHRTPPFQAADSKALLVLSGRGAAAALVAARRDLGTICARTPWSLNEPRKLASPIRAARQMRDDSKHLTADSTVHRPQCRLQLRGERIRRLFTPFDARAPILFSIPAVRRMVVASRIR